MVAETGLPPNWEAKWSSSSKRAYFYKYNGPNVKFDSIWKSPPGTNKRKLNRYLKQRIVASHLLVKHNQSRRKSSWRQDEITRSKEEARAILEGHLQAIRNGASLPELAKTESDCSSASKGGDLGEFGFGDMQEAFWLASVGLQNGEVSGIVDTASGLHLIQRFNDDPPEEEDDGEDYDF